MFWMPAGDLTPSSDRPFDELHDLFLKMRNLESNSKFLKTYNQVPCFSSFLPVFFKKTPQQFFLNQVWIQRKRGAIKKKPHRKGGMGYCPGYTDVCVDGAASEGFLHSRWKSAAVVRGHTGWRGSTTNAIGLANTIHAESVSVKQISGNDGMTSCFLFKMR